MEALGWPRLFVMTAMTVFGATFPFAADLAKVGSPPENEPALAGGRRRGRCSFGCGGE